VAILVSSLGFFVADSAIGSFRPTRDPKDDDQRRFIVDHVDDPEVADAEPPEITSD